MFGTCLRELRQQLDGILPQSVSELAPILVCLLILYFIVYFIVMFVEPILELLAHVGDTNIWIAEHEMDCSAKQGRGALDTDVVASQRQW